MSRYLALALALSRPSSNACMQPIICPVRDIHEPTTLSSSFPSTSTAFPRTRSATAFSALRRQTHEQHYATGNLRQVSLRVSACLACGCDSGRPPCESTIMMSRASFHRSNTLCHRKSLPSSNHHSFHQPPPPLHHTEQRLPYNTRSLPNLVSGPDRMCSVGTIERVPLVLQHV